MQRAAFDEVFKWARCRQACRQAEEIIYIQKDFSQQVQQTLVQPYGQTFLILIL